MFELVTGAEMKPWLSRNMLPNINTCENGWPNFSANLRVVSLKLHELTQFAWQNLSIYFNFLCAVPRNNVIESTPFLMRPLVMVVTMDVIVEISTAHSEEYMLLFSLNTLFTLIQNIKTFKTYNEGLNLTSYGINIISYLFPITITYVHIL